jgi:peptidoglycan/LPS O-acetylase OafA/YrhL
MINNNAPTSTAAAVLRANSGVGPGFDAQRLGLSVWVFTIHALYICRGAEGALQFAANPLHRIVLTPVLPMFFLVSGYLVTGSAMRTKSVSTFLLFRVFRIVPALLVEVTLSALVLGPWLTEKTLSEYFSDRLFYKYFLNILGSAHFLLPGLFVKNPFAFVNVNLWTLKPEFYCYIFMSIMMLSRIIFSRKKLSIVFIAAVFVSFAYEFRGGQMYNFLGVVNWKILIVAFVIGCVGYHWNDRIVISSWNALIALLVAGAALMYPPMIIVALFPLTYIVIYIGMQKIYLPYFLRNGDYSYGIYLFGFPVQQTLVHFLPLEYRHGLNILVLGLPLTLLFAMFSWHLIEKPTLRLKNRFARGVSAAYRSAPGSQFSGDEAGASVRSSDPAIIG